MSYGGKQEIDRYKTAIDRNSILDVLKSLLKSLGNQSQRTSKEIVRDKLSTALLICFNRISSLHKNETL